MTDTLRDALGEIAAKNDLSGIPDEELASAACNALHECELIARAALAENNQEAWVAALLNAPNPEQALAATPADVLERVAREQLSDPATDDLTVPLAIELSEMTSRAFKAEAALQAATEPKGTWSDGGKVWEGQPTPAVGGELPEAARELSLKHDWCPACHRGWSWAALPASPLREAFGRLERRLMSYCNHANAGHMPSDAREFARRIQLGFLAAYEEAGVTPPTIDPETAAEYMAALPASPLRGRDSVLLKWHKELAEMEDMDERGDLTEYGQHSLRMTRRFVDDLTASASPPEQPATVTGREIDEADYKMGWWLAGALEDPNVCAEMKAVINRWFEVHQTGLKILDQGKQALDGERS